jgi:hypothetical protein
MRLLLLIALASLTTACSTAPPEITYDFETFKAIEAEATHPSDLPKVAPLECIPSEDNCQGVGYTRTSDVDTLETFKELAIGNTEVAGANAEAVETMLAREDAILAAAKAQEQITRLREEQLAWERAERTREKWYYRVLIVLVGAAGVAAAN